MYRVERTGTFVQYPDDILMPHRYRTFISSKSRLRKDASTYTKILLLRAEPTGQCREEDSVSGTREELT
jgi:hypothetical protein